MWLLRLFKKLLKLALFIIIAGGLCIIFLGSFWCNNNYNFHEWFAHSGSQLLGTPDPSGALTAMFPSVGTWYDTTLSNYSTAIQDVFRYLIPVGFGAVFGIIIYTFISILTYLLRKMFKKKK
ncbi:MPN385 family protein [Mycoplasmoides alvi]|uniref:MPN385 family protein n=1 Tax=Mycoplasmoides alvi TaxID=78580 RepID=UPI00051BA48E|nr:hypothetical protein [Mycoplasmoides alvi]